AYAVKTQRNMQIHVVMAVLALLASWWLRISRGDVLLVFFAIALVFALELVNTAIEATVDLVTEERQPLAKAAKDASAGAVLVASILSVIIGIAVFAQPLWEKLIG
ncbi:diacylglycerol kinase family protein, partial [Microbacteriaceae bacterium K1510]|nr:diacylglycerol kinase family protein [Microbacteriaceae bacterium K1510]